MWKKAAAYCLCLRISSNETLDEAMCETFASLGAIYAHMATDASPNLWVWSDIAKMQVPLKGSAGRQLCRIPWSGFADHMSTARYCYQNLSKFHYDQPCQSPEDHKTLREMIIVYGVAGKAMGDCQQILESAGGLPLRSRQPPDWLSSDYLGIWSQ